MPKFLSDISNFFSKRITKQRNKVITIVSGLPRSGTSMMMRMLEAGGMEIVVDNIRKADKDNPHGYFEYEKVKKIKEDSSWLDHTRGKVFKMVSMLLYDLPSNRNYKIIFIKRNMREVLASQKKMLKRRERDKDGVDNEEMGRLFKKHLNQIERWLETQENIDVVYISYNDVIEKPQENAEMVNQFLGSRLNINSMLKAIDKSLYRNRVNC